MLPEKNGKMWGFFPSRFILHFRTLGTLLVFTKMFTFWVVLWFVEVPHVLAFRHEFCFPSPPCSNPPGHYSTCCLQWDGKRCHGCWAFGDWLCRSDRKQPRRSSKRFHRLLLDCLDGFLRNPFSVPVDLREWETLDHGLLPCRPKVQHTTPNDIHGKQSTTFNPGSFTLLGGRDQHRHWRDWYPFAASAMDLVTFMCCT